MVRLLCASLKCKVYLQRASSIAINRSRDKFRSYQLLARAGVGIPKTVLPVKLPIWMMLLKSRWHTTYYQSTLVVHMATVLYWLRQNPRAVMQAFYVEDVAFSQEFIKNQPVLIFGRLCR